MQPTLDNEGDFEELAVNLEYAQTFLQMYLCTGQTDFYESATQMIEGVLPSQEPSAQSSYNMFLKSLENAPELRRQMVVDTTGKQHDPSLIGPETDLLAMLDMVNTIGESQPPEFMMQFFHRMDCLEDTIAIKEWYLKFIDTNQKRYLDKAISTAETVAEKDIRYYNLHTKCILTFLEGVRDRVTPSSELPEDEEHLGLPTHIVETAEAMKELYDTFVSTGDKDYIENAIALVEEATFSETDSLIQSALKYTLLRLRLTKDSQHSAKRMESMGLIHPKEVLGDMLERKIHIGFLDRIINLSQNLIHGASSGNRLRKAMLVLDNSLGTKSRIKSLSDPFAYIMTLAREGVMAAHLSHQSRHYMIYILGMMYHTRYKWIGAQADLDDAIEWMEKSIAATPSDDPLRNKILLHLRGMLYNRYERFRPLYDADLVVQTNQHKQIPGQPISLIRLLESSSGKLSEEDNYSAPREDLGRAIDFAKEALHSKNIGNERKEALKNISEWCHSRYKWLRDMNDINTSIEHFEELAAKFFENDTERARFLYYLGASYNDRFIHYADLDDIQRAIDVSKTMVELLTQESEMGTVAMGLLSYCFAAKYTITGALEDSELAISMNQEALNQAQVEQRGDILVGRGDIFMSRYERLEHLDDLLEGIIWYRKAISEFPGEPGIQAKASDRMSGLLMKRYQRLKNVEDFEEAKKLLERLVRITNPDSPRLVKRITTLYTDVFLMENNIEDLEFWSLIRMAEKLNAGTTYGSPLWVQMQTILCLGFMRATVSDDPQIIDKAIKYFEEYIAVLPPKTELQITLNVILASLVQTRHKCNGSTEDFDYALRLSYETLNCHQAPVIVRIHNAMQTSMLLASRQMWQDSSSIVSGAIKLLPRLSKNAFARNDQEYQLSNRFLKNIASDAVSISIQAGEEVFHCVRLLELGRGVIIGRVIDCRSDATELQLKHPELYDKFNKLRLLIDSPPTTIEINPDDELRPLQQRQQLERAAQTLEETLGSIRELQGFEGFQLPPRSDELMSIASGGQIIIFNSTAIRSDAIVVTGSTIKSIALPRLCFEEVKDKMGQLADLTTGRRSTYHQRNHEFRELLLWLWDTAVEPVFSELGIETIPENEELPRVWWIGVGILAKAPFHAAGDHSPGSTRNTISRAISTYTPTIKALSYARERRLEILNGSDSRLLLASMSKTPGHQDLTNVTKEVEEIVELASGDTNISPTHLNYPTPSQVLEMLPSYHAVHFACHGISDDQSPSNSSLILRGDPEAGGRLSVGDISGINLANAQIAYLSACSTAENASKALTDESIYIASGFQLAGFSHVLATQWISNDDACRQVAVDFYKSLFDGKATKDERGHRKVSESFHFAVKKLRDRAWKQPIKWASFIHTGA